MTSADTEFYTSSSINGFAFNNDARRMIVTPEMAREWLEKECDFQRPVSQKVVKKYAETMKLGQWKLTHQGIALDTEGRLVDGRHRCSAIVLAGIPIPMMVFFDQPTQNFTAIDRGYIRSTAQIARLGGHEWVNHYQLGAIQSLSWRLGAPNSVNNSFSLEDTDFLLTAYKDQLQKIYPGGANSTTLRGGYIRGAILRALISDPRHEPRVMDFISVLQTGVPVMGEKDNSCIFLRTRLLTQKSAGSKPARYLGWNLTLSALRQFIAGKPVIHSQNLRPSAAMPFPIELDKFDRSVPLRDWQGN